MTVYLNFGKKLLNLNYDCFSNRLACMDKDWQKDLHSVPIDLYD